MIESKNPRHELLTEMITGLQKHIEIEQNLISTLMVTYRKSILLDKDMRKMTKECIKESQYIIDKDKKKLEEYGKEKNATPEMLGLEK